MAPAPTEFSPLPLRDALPIFFAARLEFQFESQPLVAIFECAPAPADGGLVCVPCPAFTNLRKRERTRRRSEEHTSELQSQSNLVCRLLLEKKNIKENAATWRK